jgi:hypothetical protein
MSIDCIFRAVTAAGCGENMIIERLGAKFDGSDAILFEKVTLFFIDDIGTSGKTDLIGKPFNYARTCFAEKSALGGFRKCGEASSEESDFDDCSVRYAFPKFKNPSRNIIWRCAVAFSGDCPLIAEDTIMTASHVRNEEWDGDMSIFYNCGIPL